MARPPRSLRTSLAIAALSLTTSCAHRPPQHMVSNRIWAPHHSGYVFRTGYYSAVEVWDLRWERGRRQMRRMANYCDAARERVVRRDIIWYPATPASGRRCAAIIYTLECHHENKLVSSSADEIRRELIASAPQRPMERGCGNKDRDE